MPTEQLTSCDTTTDAMLSKVLSQLDVEGIERDFHVTDEELRKVDVSKSGGRFYLRTDGRMKCLSDLIWNPSSPKDGLIIHETRNIGNSPTAITNREL
jgi:hypothetical protein